MSFVVSCFGKEVISKNDIVDTIQIKADNMEYNTDKKEADAAGNVFLHYVVNQALVVLKADNLHAIFDDDGNLIKAVAEGNVEIDHKDTKLLAAKCVHDFTMNTAVCFGDDVLIMKDKNELHGRLATLDIKNHVFTMQTDLQEQIRCIIYPNKEQKNKNS